MRSFFHGMIHVFLNCSVTPTRTLAYARSTSSLNCTSHDANGEVLNLKRMKNGI